MRSSPERWDIPALGARTHSAVSQGPLALAHLLGQQTAQRREVDPWNDRGSTARGMNPGKWQGQHYRPISLGLLTHAHSGPPC